MNIMRRIAWLISWASIVASPVFCQANGKQSLNVRVDKNTIVRIFYLPPYSYFHVPLSFRVWERTVRCSVPPRLQTPKTERRIFRSRRCVV
jgi:hypothetical protein